MASAVILHNIVSVSLHHQSPKYWYKNKTQALLPSQFIPFKSLSLLKKQSLLSPIQISKLKSRQTSAVPVIYAAQSNLFRVLQTVWKVGKDGVEAGTNLVPDSVPRPIARISVTVVGVALALFVLKSFLSTAFFVLAMMGLIYFTFLALNKDEGPKGGGGFEDEEGPKGGGGTSSTEDSLEEARRIMEKYK